MIEVQKEIIDRRNVEKITPHMAVYQLICEDDVRYNINNTLLEKIVRTNDKEGSIAHFRFKKDEKGIEIATNEWSDGKPVYLPYNLVPKLN
jgi:hypothetical protein